MLTIQPLVASGDAHLRRSHGPMTSRRRLTQKQSCPASSLGTVLIPKTRCKPRLRSMVSLVFLQAVNGHGHCKMRLIII